MTKNQLCYFCDNIYPHSSCFIGNYNDIWVCYDCEMIIPINIQEQGKCCVCLEDNPLNKLPTCIHKVCLECCKTIYFGSTKNERPIHEREITIESPDWPYELNDDDYDIKYDEYCDFERKYFNFDLETSSYDELITIRNSFIMKRPEWMNTEKFINYENFNFRYHLECIKLEKEWEIYNENKTKGNSSCPLCRSKPL